MTGKPKRTLVLGLGNLVHSDDGVGVHAIHRLRGDARVPAGVALMDGGTLGLELAGYLSGFQRLLAIDAVDAGEPAGTLIRLEGKAIESLPGKASVHLLGFADLMVTLRLLGEAPEEIVVLGVQPLSTEWSVELTAPVRGSLEKLLTAAIGQLDEWARADAREGGTDGPPLAHDSVEAVCEEKLRPV